MWAWDARMLYEQRARCLLESTEFTELVVCFCKGLDRLQNEHFVFEGGLKKVVFEPSVVQEVLNKQS